MTFWDFLVWTFWFYLVVVCITIFIRVIIDVFRDPELNGWAKALWVLFLVIFPFLAAFIYLIARGGRMAQRSMAGAAQAQQANDQYISALYQHNIAKLSLARALGAAQTKYKDYLGGK